VSIRIEYRPTIGVNPIGVAGSRSDQATAALLDDVTQKKTGASQ